MNSLAMTKPFIALTAILLVAGCSVGPEYEYRLSGHYDQILERQILDPAAPEMNAGIVNSLDGDVASKNIEAYKNSIYQPKEARGGGSSFNSGSGSASTGKN
ncbi:hypothetical protein [Thalassotalea sp. PS06]|uniref:hypothetical protein n=1 Tax=Thalassotalea sp. PS06 TaxID=2594005 RepID=UPI0011633AD8|nr:hypothetical protein [Thalassotalea sp. PS06]QDP02065.1 hypothetical protein FNC98_12385 [Thalassotalea sp. PS06]